MISQDNNTQQKHQHFYYKEKRQSQNILWYQSTTSAINNISRNKSKSKLQPCHVTSAIKRQQHQQSTKSAEAPYLTLIDLSRWLSQITPLQMECPEAEGLLSTGWPGHWSLLGVLLLPLLNKILPSTPISLVSSDKVSHLQWGISL